MITGIALHSSVQRYHMPTTKSVGYPKDGIWYG